MSRSPSAMGHVSLFLIGMTAISILVLARSPDFIPASLSLNAPLPLSETLPVASGREVLLFPDPTPVSGAVLGQGDARMVESRKRFDQGVYMLHAGLFEEAVTALHRVILLSPRLTDAQVNMGYALLGLKRYQAAEQFFRKAIDLSPYQGNAYWGLAETLEAQRDLSGALGAMRTYIHLGKPGDPYVRRARAALWEWESQLKHGPPSPQDKAWMVRRQAEDAARNSPQQDAPPADELNMPVGDSGMHE